MFFSLVETTNFQTLFQRFFELYTKLRLSNSKLRKGITRITYFPQSCRHRLGTRVKMLRTNTIVFTSLYSRLWRASNQRVLIYGHVFSSLTGSPAKLEKIIHKYEYTCSEIRCTPSVFSTNNNNPESSPSFTYISY